MNIYFKLKAFPQVSETFIVNNLVYAKQRGFDIKIITDRYLGLENSSQADILKKYNIETDIVKPFSFSKNKFKKLFQVLFILSHLRILKYVYAYYKLKRKKNLLPLATLYQYRNLKNGILHVHFNNALEALIDLAKIGYIKPKCIVTFHGYDAFLDDREGFQKKYGVFYRKHVVAVTTNSNYLKEKVVQLGVDESKINVVPIGFDPKRFKGSPRELPESENIKLITVGRLVQLKGQIYMIKALSKLKQKDYNISYTIVGSGNYENTLKTETENLGLTDHIYFEGSKTQEEIKTYLQKSNLFILPSTYDDNNGRKEAFGLVSLEAQATGLPVIGFISGGFPDTIIEGKTGFAVENRNIEQLADKIEHLISHPSIYLKMSKAAINHAQKFDHQKTTQQYLDLYQKFNA